MDQVTDKSYSKSVECKNCDKFNNLEIPFGKNVLEFIAESKPKCENCGCVLVINRYSPIHSKN